MLTFSAALRGSTCQLCCRRGVWLWGCRGFHIVGRLVLIYTLGHAWAALLRFRLCTAVLLLCCRMVVDAWLQTRSQHAPAVLLRVISTYLQGSKRSMTRLHKRCSLP